jgi:tripartite ATP-independent transporter DctP family solute receptor
MTAGLLFSSAAYAQEVRDMKFRFSLQPPKGTSQYDGSKKFADLVAEKSKGKMDVKVFEGGSIGSDAAAISSLQGGTIDFLITWTGNLSGLDKTFSLFDFPFLFKTFDEADKVIDGPVGEKLMARLPAKGLKGLAYAELGFRHIHDSKRPINKLEDLQGLKIRVMNSNLYVDFMNALGANAMAMNFTELFTALEMKTVDGATNPTDNIVSTRFYEVQKYLSLSRHMYSVMMFVMSEKTWNKLNAAEQKIVMDSAKEAGIYQRQVSRRMDKDNLVFLAKHLQVSEIPASELAKMREKSQPVVDKWSKEVGIDLYNELLAELKKVRQ